MKLIGMLCIGFVKKIIRIRIFSNKISKILFYLLNRYLHEFIYLDYV